MKLLSLQAHNFRCFADVSIDFDEQLTVLTGKNGCGKSALLEIAACFLKAIACAPFCPFPDLPAYANFRHGATTLDLNFSYCETGQESMMLKQKYAIANGEIARKSFVDMSTTFSETGKLPVVAFYGSKRILNKYNRIPNFKPDLKSIFASAFDTAIDFSATYTWFIEKNYEEAMEAMHRKDMNFCIAELDAVRKAVAKALGNYDNPFVAGTPPKIYICPKDSLNNRYALDELSDGYRTMLALVMDLARRMAVFTEVLDLPRETVLDRSAIVLIDEIELHLHPAWQQTVLPTLLHIFPNTQFIVTTHSPQVISAVESRQVRIIETGSKVHKAPDGIWGAETSRLLEEVFGTPIRAPSSAVDELKEYTTLVYADKWDNARAVKLRGILDKRYGNSEPKLLELDMYIENKKWEMEENNETDCERAMPATAQ